MKKIAIIGASYLQLPLVKKAKEMGVETHCFAWEEGAVCREFADCFYPVSILDKEVILDKCSELKIDGITSIASDAAVPTISYIAQQLGLVSNDYRDVNVCTNKFEMRKRFVENNLKCPKFVFADTDVDVSSFSFPLIVKPTDRSGSRGVIKIRDKADLKSSITRAKNESFISQAIVEEFISGKEVSVEAVSWKGKHYVLAITDKVTTGEPYYVELEHHQPSQLSFEIQQKIKTETEKALRALNIEYGATHSEFIITQEGDVYIIEVGARMGGDFIGSTLVELSTGYDFLKAVIDIALRSFEEPKLINKKYSGVYFICSETKHLLNVLNNHFDFNEIVEFELTDNEFRNVQCSADRSGYFIYQSTKKFVP